MKKFDLALSCWLLELAVPVIPAHAQTAGVTDSEILLGSSVDLKGPSHHRRSDESRLRDSRDVINEREAFMAAKSRSRRDTATIQARDPGRPEADHERRVFALSGLLRLCYHPNFRCDHLARVFRCCFLRHRSASLRSTAELSFGLLMGTICR